MKIEKLMADVHETAKSKVWWDKPMTVLEDICLFHSEASEMTEDWRANGLEKMISYDEKGKPSGLAIEAADLVIRVLDFCAARSVPIVDALEIKANWNKTRSYRHGNKLA